MDNSEPLVLHVCVHCRDWLHVGALAHPERAAVALTLCPDCCHTLVPGAGLGLPVGVRLLGNARGMLAGSGGSA